MNALQQAIAKASAGGGGGGVKKRWRREDDASDDANATGAGAVGGNEPALKRARTDAGFKRRGEVEQEREASYREQEERRRREKEELKRKLPGLAREQSAAAQLAAAAAAVTSTGADSAASASSGNTSNTVASKSLEGLAALDMEEIFRRLRFRREPVTLFGEEHTGRLKRLRDLEVLKPLDYQEITSTTTDEYGRHLGKDVEDTGTRRLLVGEDSEVAEYTRDIDATAHYTTNSLHSREDVVAFVVRKLLFNWSADISMMSTEEHESLQGRNIIKNHKECREQLKPLLRKLRSRAIDNDEVDKLYTIASLLQQRRYADANQLYLLLAIGNEAWPMGVTMVGIHERASRSRISETGEGVSGARIMQDETHRKYLHGFKRLMTQCQERYPSLDPDQVWKNL